MKKDFILSATKNATAIFIRSGRRKGRTQVEKAVKKPTPPAFKERSTYHTVPKRYKTASPESRASGFLILKFGKSAVSIQKHKQSATNPTR